MFDISTVQLDWQGLNLKLETGIVARQADGAVVATLGSTSVLCTVCAAKKSDPTIDFFPLSVHYIEKAYAAGKIPGGFFKREGRPSEIEILNSRLIDRPMRPLFHKDFKNETQIVCTVLNYEENDPAICAMIGASAAATIAGLPFLGPIACSRVGYNDGEYILNPTKEELSESELDLVVAGTRDGVLMVESEACELPEDIMLGAVQFGFKEFQCVIDKIIELAEKSAKDSWEIESPDLPSYIKELQKEAEKSFDPIYKIKEKKKRNESLNKTRAEMLVNCDNELHIISDAVKSVEKELVRASILKTGKRIDGRDLNTVRDINVKVDFLENVHGCALFTRGETQALVTTTLGTSSDEQMLDTLDGDRKEKFLLHYNFPPFSVNEVGRMGSTGRREVGHGKLAWRAINPILKKVNDFPYTLRVVSEITESNGSSSMASVCGASLSLMDAGVPLEKSVAGVAMGLIKEEVFVV